MDSEPQATEKKQTQTETLLAIAEEMRLSKTPEGEAYAQVPVDGHWETYPLKSKAVKDWLTHAYRKREAGVPNKTAMEQTMAALEAEARFDSDTREVYLRLAWLDGLLYLDLNNECDCQLKSLPYDPEKSATWG